MDCKVVGLIENDTAMRSSITILRVKGIETGVVCSMVDTGVDLEACGIIPHKTPFEEDFSLRRFLDGDGAYEYPKTLLLDGIYPGLLTAELRRYSKHEGVADLSRAAGDMAIRLDDFYQRRVDQIETFLSNVAFSGL